MSFHEGVKLVEVEKWNHGVAVVLGVVVGVPKDSSDEKAGMDSACVQQTVRHLVDFAVRVFQIAEEVDNRVTNKDWADPPEGKILQALFGLSKDNEHGNVPCNLAPSALLNLAHDAALSTVVPIVEAPLPAAVVNCLTKCWVGNSSNSHLEGTKDVQESVNVSHTCDGDISESWLFELFAGVVAGELRVLVNIVRIGMVLLVHHAFMSSKLECEAADSEETSVVEPLSLKGIAVEELVLSGKRKGLELKSIEGVKEQKSQYLQWVRKETFIKFDVQAMKCISRQGHDAQVGYQAFKTLGVRLGHELDQDTVWKYERQRSEGLIRCLS